MTVSITDLPPIDRSSDWRSRAACLGMDVNIFFEYGRRERDIRRARRVCQECPVRAECLNENLDIRFGMYGGMTEFDRAALKRRMRRQARLAQERREAAS